jgi:hypothetical protein
VKAKKLLIEKCRFIDLFYKELTDLPHKPANNHSEDEWVFNKYGHHRNLLPKTKKKKKKKQKKKKDFSKHFTNA